MESAQYEHWQRTIIDLLVKDKWELSRVQPYPPLTQWYEKGITPEEAHKLIRTHHKYPGKKYKARGGKKVPKTVPKADPLPKYPRLAQGTQPDR